MFFFCLLVLESFTFRLAGGDNNRYGRIEAKYGVKWATICRYGWSNIVASVMCKQLGFDTGTGHKKLFGGGSGPTHVIALKCLGNESKLQECELSRMYNDVIFCPHDQDIGVVCAYNNDCEYKIMNELYSF